MVAYNEAKARLRERSSTQYANAIINTGSERRGPHDGGGACRFGCGGSCCLLRQAATKSGKTRNAAGQNMTAFSFATVRDGLPQTVRL